jgi:hypothetical protein
MLENTNSLDPRRAAAKRTALVLAVVAISVFIGFILKALSL